MELIHHRVNSAVVLRKVPQSAGVEIDVRSQQGALQLAHDPYVSGEDLDEWLSSYDHGTLIVNVKEEGLEEAVLALLDRHSITNFFLLDQSVPFLVRYLRTLNGRSAVRVSDLEGTRIAKAMSGGAHWAWLDWFGDYRDFDRNLIVELSELRYRICLVSPELRGHSESEIPPLRRLIGHLASRLSAVCTKRPDLWSVGD